MSATPVPSTATAPTAVPSARLTVRDLTAELSSRLALGSAAGLVAGLPFIVFTMLWATRHAGPGVAPLVGISTIFNLESTPHPTTANVAIGLVTHLNLSLLFGVGFALLLPLLRNLTALVVGAGVYGALLYLINFQILARFAFPGLFGGSTQWFEAVVHIMFGLLLVPFLIAVWRQTIAPRSAAG